MMTDVRKSTATQAGVRNRRVGHWLMLVAVSVMLVILGIKLAVYSFLNSVPDDFFARHAPDLRPAVPDAVVMQEVEPVPGYLWQTLPADAPAPLENPTTAAKVALGEKLFFDKNLSLDRTLACASCHELYSYAGTDGAPVSTGINGQKGNRNAPTVWNAAFQKRLFWDGRAASLEQQAIKPFLNPIEMGMLSPAQIVERVKEQAAYQPEFAAAFADEPDITIANIVRAIASYERSLITNDSPYDDYVRGDSAALTEQQLSGMVLFEKTGCVHCHFGPNFSAASIYNSGLPFRVFPANPDPITQQYGLNTESDGPAVWRVPSLRNVALTGPWFHNGAVDDLRDVVRIMARTQLARSQKRSFQWSAKKLGIIENPDLTDQQVEDIVAFLKALSSRRLTAAEQQHLTTR
ncbi:cytochrome-c peroxidase [Amphritea pacifica]|uniref:cytochrome-c peroxidase n=1 Tax=Amphritea pacifica TaxID=2811233 RepID=UPI00196377CD|nr:cytochrome c peroxidase [Amphritea pacifica]MBN1005340.1 c-type cytochrome [Amphritea pacifica]